jgi:hypothetical protein
MSERSPVEALKKSRSRGLELGLLIIETQLIP